MELIVELGLYEYCPNVVRIFSIRVLVKMFYRIYWLHLLG